MNKNKKHCLVVTCLPCNTPFYDKESPHGCAGCGMLDYLCFETEQEANESFKKQHPDMFDENGKYIGLKKYKKLT